MGALLQSGGHDPTTFGLAGYLYYRDSVTVKPVNDILKTVLYFDFMLCQYQRSIKVKRLKLNKALNKNSSLSYGTSPAIWDHTVLPATRHK